MKKILIIVCTFFAMITHAQDYPFISDNLKLLPQEELFKKPPPTHIDLVYYEDGTQTTWDKVLPLIMSGKLIPKMYVNSKGEYKALVAVKVDESKAKEGTEIPYEAKMADLGEIQMEYFDYGGDGPTIIVLQDFHNYYSGPMAYPPDHPLIDFYKSLTQQFRVLAPLKRGYGRSTESHWGYDVATLSEDLLDFMNALDIEKAFLYGRVPANQEMTWIAEHNPERLLGLIYDGNPVITVGCMDSEVLEFADNIQTFAMDGFDRDKARQVYLSRSMWRPRFLKDTSKRIDVPAIRFSVPGQEGMTPNLAFGTKEALKETLEIPIKDRDEAKQYVRELLQDSVRYENLYQKLKDCNISDAVEEGMKRAFTDNLTTLEEPTEFNEPTMQSYIGILDWQRNHIFEFKQRVLE
ncbi:alpha/beta fold hydrolase [Muriicola sp.]|uniref:alpha/beta fold hydrolase n=1 Tax=Muriicola sp. TaxID=2020856 RepID=UPI003C786081